MRGLVLEGGGVKGAYQVGAFYAFRDCKIKFRGFVGTSIGSFNAVMLASKKEGKLLDFWYNLNPGILLGMDERFIELFNDKYLDIQGVIGAFSSLKGIIKNLGLDNTKLLSVVKSVVNYDDLMRSNYDFGLCTVRVTIKGLEPVYIYKEDILNHDNLIDYLMASCYLPFFREKRIIDNHYYLDGGFYDNSPVKLLKDKGYDEVYVISIRGIGINRMNSYDGIKATLISPSRDNGRVLELDRSVIRDNIMMGYYDTLRVLKKLDGYKYCFKRKSLWQYEFMTRKINKRFKRRVMNFFKVETLREAIIKSLEYIMEKENIDYYDVYNPFKIVKDVRKIESKHFIYKFVKEIKFF